MAYTRTGMTDNIGTKNGPIVNDGVLWRGYASSTDTLSQIQTDGYFNQAVVDYDLQVGTILYARGTDSNTEILEVSAISPDVVTQSVISAISIPDGSITTAKLANGAVTGQKTASSTIGTNNIVTRAIVVDKLAFYSSSNTEPTSQIMHVLEIPSSAGTSNHDKTFSGTGMTITNISVTATSNGATANSIKIQNSSGNDITEEMNAEFTNTQTAFFPNNNTANNVVNIGGFVRAVVVDGGNPATAGMVITFYGYPRS